MLKSSHSPCVGFVCPAHERRILGTSSFSVCPFACVLGMCSIRHIVALPVLCIALRVYISVYVSLCVFCVRVCNCGLFLCPPVCTAIFLVCLLYPRDECVRRRMLAMIPQAMTGMTWATTLNLPARWHEISQIRARSNS